MELTRRYVDDPRALRALAHPVRQQILRRLAGSGPATSAILARELDEDRGCTSFHLRQLGSYGYIEVDDSLSTGRSKYWRLIRQDLRFPKRLEEPGGEEGAAVVSSLWQESLAALVRSHEQGDPWWSEAEVSHSDLRLTQGELRSFGEAYLTLLRRYLRPADETPADARPVIALFAAFPAPTDP